MMQIEIRGAQSAYWPLAVDAWVEKVSECVAGVIPPYEKPIWTKVSYRPLVYSPLLSPSPLLSGSGFVSSEIQWQSRDDWIVSLSRRK